MNYWTAIGIFFLGAGSGALLTRIATWGQFRRMKAEFLRHAERPESESNIVGDGPFIPRAESVENGQSTDMEGRVNMDDGRAVARL